MLKANGVADNLRAELGAEKESSAALQQQNVLLTTRLEAAKDLALATAKAYAAALEQFGGSTSGMPEEPSAFKLLTWLKSHVEKLPWFVRDAVDFGAMAGATTFAKVLARGGCTHTEGV